MCEVARNSVLQSGFEHEIKKRWLGDDYHIAGPAGNDIHKTNVPNIRMTYRHQTLMEERLMVLSELRNATKAKSDTGPLSASDGGASVPGGVEGVLKAEMSSSPHFGNFPGEPLLEHVLKAAPDFYNSPKHRPINDEDASALNIGGPVLGNDSLAHTRSFPGVSLLAERLAREGRITSLLDKGFEQDDGDDIWE